MILLYVSLCVNVTCLVYSNYIMLDMDVSLCDLKTVK